LRMFRDRVKNCNGIERQTYTSREKSRFARIAFIRLDDIRET
jgi:hypothetical protein